MNWSKLLALRVGPLLGLTGRQYNAPSKAFHPPRRKRSCAPSTSAGVARRSRRPTATISSISASLYQCWPSWASWGVSIRSLSGLERRLPLQRARLYHHRLRKGGEGKPTGSGSEQMFHAYATTCVPEQVAHGRTAAPATGQKAGVNSSRTYNGPYRRSTPLRQNRPTVDCPLVRAPQRGQVLYATMIASLMK